MTIGNNVMPTHPNISDLEQYIQILDQATNASPETVGPLWENLVKKDSLKVEEEEDIVLPKFPDNLF